MYICKIDKNKIGKYRDKIKTDEVVLTNERNIHIFKNHFKDYKTIIKNIKGTILNPEYIMEDGKNIDTILYIRKLKRNNLNVVIKLNTVNNKQHPKNSIMTAWIIRNSNLRKLIKKNKIIYKTE